MDENLTIIENRIKFLRERLGYTQYDLAKMLNISRSLVAIWENGYANISLKQIIKFCNVYDVSLDYLLGIVDVPKDYDYCFINNLNLKYVGEKIKEIRKNEKLTQEKFASKIFTKRSNISYYEIGKMMISTADLKQICETFGYSADYIVGNTFICIKRVKKQKIKTKDIKEFIAN